MSVVPTQLTGIFKATNPHKTLHTLYKRILLQLEKMPSDAAYRVNTTKIIKERQAVIERETTPEGVVNALKSGQIEEIIIQAENELDLAKKMLEYKPWEPLTEHPPPDQWKWPI